MPISSIFLYLVQALVFGFLGFILCRWLVRHNIKIVKLSGRLNRIDYLLWSVALYVIYECITALYATLMEQVISEPGYWGLQFLAWLLTILLLPFYYSLYARRFQDFSIHGFVGIVITILFLFLLHFTVVKIWNTFFSIVFILYNLFLFCIPGTRGINNFGVPSVSWPTKKKIHK